VKSAVETLNPTRVRLTVEVPFEELKPSLDAAYKKIAGQVSVPGFRKGKVPPAIIDKRFGRAAVLEEAVNEALPKFYGEAVQEREIQVIGPPQVDISEFADGEELKFTAEVDVKPEIVLPDYNGLEVTVDDAEVTESDVEEQLNALRERFATLVGVDRPVEDGDFVLIDLAASTKEGQEITDAKSTGVTYQIGSGALITGLDEALVGMTVGQAKTFESELLAGPLKGEQVDVAVTLGAVKVRELPELDEEFAQSVSEFDTLDELRADMSKNLAQHKKLEQGGQARDKVLEALLAKIDVPLPAAFLEEEIKFRQRAISQQLESAGLTLETYLEHEDQTREDFDADIVQRAEEGMRAQFVLDEVAKKEQLQIGQEELTRHLIQRAQNVNMNPDQFAQQVVDSGQAQALVAEVVRSKALALILSTAKVTDVSGREVDLSGLRPGGPELDAQVAAAQAQYAAELAGHDHDHEGHDHGHEGHDHGAQGTVEIEDAEVEAVAGAEPSGSTEHSDAAAAEDVLVEDAEVEAAVVETAEAEDETGDAEPAVATESKSQ
jgi:trigger factor